MAYRSSAKKNKEEGKVIHISLPLLQSRYLLGAVDDEVAPGVQGTLVELTQITIRQAAQQAVGGAEHDGDFTDEGLLVLGQQLVLALLDDGLGDVHVERGRVPRRRAGGGDQKDPLDHLWRPGAEMSTLLLNYMNLNESCYLCL